MTLLEYLKQPQNSLVREDCTTSTLISELKLSALTQMRRIKIYKQEIDIEGCDLIVEDDTDFTRKFQIKSIIQAGQRKSFEIHSNILLPDFDRCTDYGFDNVFGPKTMGGVIKQNINVSNTIIQIKYEYTDFNVISFLAFNNKKVAAKKLLESLLAKDKRVKVSRDLFIPLANIKSLFKVAGFFQQNDFDNYCNRYYKLSLGLESSNNRKKEMETILNSMNSIVEQLNRE